MGVGKVPDETEAGLQASLEGNHDHPKSGTQQAPSHWEPQWKEAQILTKKASREEGGLVVKKQLELLHAKATWAKWLTPVTAL